MIIDHLTISVSNFERSRAFYERALQPLGITTLARYDGFAGMGKTRPQFWFAQGEVNKHKTHIAFVAGSRAESTRSTRRQSRRRRRQRAPGLRTIYHPTYYGAFVFDPDGYNSKPCATAPMSDVNGSRTRDAGSPARPGHAFEAAFAKAQIIIAAADGYVASARTLPRTASDRYLLLVQWRDLDAHITGFRGSADYQQWKALLHHFYDPFPTVLHFDTVFTSEP